MVDIKKEQEREELHDLAVKRFPDAPQRGLILFPYPPQWDCLNMCLFHFETAPAILLLTDISIMLFDIMHSF